MLETIALLVFIAAAYVFGGFLQSDIEEKEERYWRERAKQKHDA